MEYISEYQKLSESFIEKHSDKVIWYYISYYQNLSEDFIEKFSDKVDLNSISRCQKLSEDFIEKYSNKVYWFSISEYQILSEQFIEKYLDKIDLYYISRYQKLSKSFIKKHNLYISKYNWNYKTNEEKLDLIKKCNKYEIINNEFVIAYKSVRDDYRSVHKSNFYKYEINKFYESHCDCNSDNENSFGLSAWTKEKALEYYPEGKLLKVKIHINDIGCLVKYKYKYKLRCKRFQIIEEINF